MWPVKKRRREISIFRFKNMKSDSYETDSSDFEDIYDDNELR